MVVIDVHNVTASVGAPELLFNRTERPYAPECLHYIPMGTPDNVELMQHTVLGFKVILMNKHTANLSHTNIPHNNSSNMSINKQMEVLTLKLL